MTKALLLGCMYAINAISADLQINNLSPKARILFFESDSINQPCRLLHITIKPSTSFQDIANKIMHAKKTDGQLFYHDTKQEMTYSKENFINYGIRNHNKVPIFTHFNDFLFFITKPKKTAPIENTYNQKKTRSQV